MAREQGPTDELPMIRGTEPPYNNLWVTKLPGKLTPRPAVEPGRRTPEQVEADGRAAAGMSMKGIQARQAERYGTEGAQKRPVSPTAVGKKG